MTWIKQEIFTEMFLPKFWDFGKWIFWQWHFTYRNNVKREPRKMLQSRPCILLWCLCQFQNKKQISSLFLTLPHPQTTSFWVLCHSLGQKKNPTLLCDTSLICVKLQLFIYTWKHGVFTFFRPYSVCGCAIQSSQMHCQNQCHTLSACNSTGLA